jgi:putative restriction endonuclease
VARAENHDVRDDELRAVCFRALDALRAQLGDELPYNGALDQGFSWRNRRVPFFSTQKGIFRAAAQTGVAALAVQTSANSPYRDSETDEGFLYDYRAGPLDQSDNRALRAAFELQLPLVYYVGIRPGWYRPEYPIFVLRDSPADRQVLLSPGRRTPSGDPRFIEDDLERSYVVVEVRARVHQSRFRARVIPAYRSQCAMCQLKEVRLLDAAHIIGDAQQRGEPVISNGLSLCSIHHRAFDEDLVGVTPDYVVEVSDRLREDEDGPMLEVLKTAHGLAIQLPRRSAWRPDQARLALRFERFRAAS